MTESPLIWHTLITYLLGRDPKKYSPIMVSDYVRRGSAVYPSVHNPQPNDLIQRMSITQTGVCHVTLGELE